MAKHPKPLSDAPLTFTFDDVLIKPKSSSIEPRQAKLANIAIKGIELRLPILSAAMDRVTETAMAIVLAETGGLGILHRNCDIAKQCEMVKEVKKTKTPAGKLLVGAACGPFDEKRAFSLYEAGADVICIDCAHGHNMLVLASAKKIIEAMKKASKKDRKNCPKFIIGNIVTKEAVKDMSGFADAVKVGVGPGSICTTRIISGVGMPQLTAVLEVVGEARKYGIPVIADGGIKNSGDMAKAFAAGASAVMVGNMLAGTDETPGGIVVGANSKKYKEYRGMGSEAVLKERRADDRYLTKGRKAVAEGVSGLVPYKGSAKDLLETLESGVQVAMGYVGAPTMKEFQKRAEFVRVSAASVSENHPHDLFQIIS